MQFRGYDPALGRFMQIDPLTGYIPGISQYQFGFNNPVRTNDPLGLYPSSDRYGRSTTIRDMAEEFRQNSTEEYSDPNPDPVAYTDEEGNEIKESDIADGTLVEFGVNIEINGELVTHRIDGYYFYPTNAQSSGGGDDKQEGNNIPKDGAHFFDSRGNKIYQLGVGTNLPFEIYTVKDENLDNFMYAMNKNRADAFHLDRRWNPAMFYSERAKVRTDSQGNYYYIPERDWSFWVPEILGTGLSSYLKVYNGGHSNGLGQVPSGFYEKWQVGIRLKWEP